MFNWKELSNSEIITKLQEMQFEHEQLKDFILKSWTVLEQIEVDFENGNIELTKRKIQK